jgi:hypothetical protein
VTALFGLRPPADAEGRNLFREEKAPVELVLLIVVGGTVAAVGCAVFIRKRRQKTVELAPSISGPPE